MKIRRWGGVVVVVAVLSMVIAGGCRDGSERAEGTIVDGGQPTRLDPVEREAMIDAFEAAEDERQREHCEGGVAALAAMAFVISHETTRPSLPSAADREAWDAQEQELVASVPDELRDEIELVRDVARDVADEVGPVTLEDLTDRDVQHHVDGRMSVFETEEMDAVGEAFDEYMLGCPGFGR
ncbi:MAG TPA: hypothetical protein VIY72_10275 [Acidimicrobiales bacterium]